MIRQFVGSLRLAARRVRWDRALGVVLAAAVLLVALFGAAHLCGDVHHDGHGHPPHDGHDPGPSAQTVHDVAGCGLCFAWTASRSAAAARAAPPATQPQHESGAPPAPDAQRIASFERHAFAAPRGPPAV